MFFPVETQLIQRCYNATFGGIAAYFESWLAFGPVPVLEFVLSGQKG